MKITRRLFIVPLADNDHGKTTMLNALLAQGLGAESPAQKGIRNLISPSGRDIDAYVFVRSYQETEHKKYSSVEQALRGNDPRWNERELIIFPSHVYKSTSDVNEMIVAAHEAGFDAICASVLLDPGRRSYLGRIWGRNWDERWTLPNPKQEDVKARTAQLNALGCDLWIRICKTLTP